MKFTDLSPAANALLAELERASSAWLDRRDRIVAVLHRMAAAGEIVLIPQVCGFLLDRDRAVVHEAAGTLKALFMRVTAARFPALDELMRQHDGCYVPTTHDPRWHKLEPVRVNAYLPLVVSGAAA